jgi:hypothetical protein
MRLKLISAITILLGNGFLLGCVKHLDNDCRENGNRITTRVFATGLHNPRGLKFGPDSHLYVAEGGLGGQTLSSHCAQVVPPVGPYYGSNTGSRISRIGWDGVRTTFVDNLPSSTNQPSAGSAILGVADVEFLDNNLYALLAGAGCSHGVPAIPNSVIKIHQDRSWNIVSNLSQYLMTHPVANPDPDDFEPDGTPYSMTSDEDQLFITQPNQQEIDMINPSNGRIQRVVDISILHPGQTGGWIGPTSMVYHHGNLYFGTLMPFPVVQGTAKVYKLSTEGNYTVYASGFTTILGIAFDNHNRLYVLENTVGLPQLTPGFGDVVRVDPSGARQVIVSGLHLPTAMTFGPDGKLYISDWGIGPTALGQIIQVSFGCGDVGSDSEN